MKNCYEFKLAPAYCLFNGAAILSQSGCEIEFLVENIEDEVLQRRLKKAFINHLDYLKELASCPEEYKNLPKVTFVAGRRSDVRKYVSDLYKKGDFYDDEKKLVLEGGEARSAGEKKESAEAAAVLLLDSLLMEARNRSASDIHIEKGSIRFRVKGQLESYVSLPAKRCSELVQRIKLLSGMNVLEKRRSQDGHFVYGSSKPVFIRVSSMPIYDEKLMAEESLVLRLLDTTRLPLDISRLGFSEKQLELISDLENLKNGLVLVCGPTGSGKSTTIASILTEIEKKNFRKKKIMSLEDPPEYVIPDVCQIQVDGKRKDSYREALVHIFRQDPDVIMIGEIRDEISAETAVRAALTGHLVFASLHTGSAGESLLRLGNLGVDKDILSSVLKGVICQELEFLDDTAQLFADLAIPHEDYLNLEDFDNPEDLFLHVNNYRAGFDKSLQLMGLRHKAGLPLIRKWNGENDGKKADKRLG